MHREIDSHLYRLTLPKETMLVASIIQVNCKNFKVIQAKQVDTVSTLLREFSISNFNSKYSLGEKEAHRTLPTYVSYASTCLSASCRFAFLLAAATWAAARRRSRTRA